MTAPQRKSSYFPELKGERQREADEWLREYLRLVIRIHRDHLARSSDNAAMPTSIDDTNGTGKLCTPKFGDAPRHP